jgi:hypothetical protein
MRLKHAWSRARRTTVMVGFVMAEAWGGVSDSMAEAWENAAMFIDITVAAASITFFEI